MPATKFKSITSDWHLDKYAWSKYPTLSGDSQYALKQIIDYSIDHQLDIIGAGDLFDKTSPDSDTVWAADTQISRLPKHGRKLYFIRGQHDKVRGLPWLRTSQDIIHIHNTKTKLGDFTIYGIDYTRPDELEREIDFIPKDTDILVMHQVWKNFMGHFCVCDGAFSMLPPVKLLITGDFHKTCVHRNIINGNKFTAVSPGSTNIRSIDESENKYFFVLYDDLSLEQVPLKCRQVFRLVISNEEEIQTFLDRSAKRLVVPQQGVPDNITKNIIDIKYSTDIDDAYNRLTAAVNPDKAHLFLRPIKKKLITDTPDSINIKDFGLEEGLKQFCLPESDLYKNIMTLLKTDNPSFEVNNLVNRLLKDTDEAKLSYTKKLLST